MEILPWTVTVVYGIVCIPMISCWTIDRENNVPTYIVRFITIIDVRMKFFQACCRRELLHTALLLVFGSILYPVVCYYYSSDWSFPFPSTWPHVRYILCNYTKIHTIERRKCRLSRRYSTLPIPNQRLYELETNIIPDIIWLLAFLHNIRHPPCICTIAS